MLDEEIYDSVRDLLNLDYRKVYSDIVSQSRVYIFDNMIFTYLNKLTDADLAKILSSFTKSDYILIPLHIMYETAQNKNMTHEAYDSLYLRLFQKLSAVKKVCVLSFDDMYNILLESSANHTIAFGLLKSFAEVSNELNMTICKEIKNSHKDHQEINRILVRDPKNSGERIINLLVLILLNDGIQQVYTCSNDTKGIYSVRKIMRKHEALLKLLALTKEQFGESHVVFSWDRILFEYVRSQVDKTDVLMDFLKRCRDERHYSRQIYYVENNNAEHESLNNDEFLKLVLRLDAQLTY